MAMISNLGKIIHGRNKRSSMNFYFKRGKLTYETYLKKRNLSLRHQKPVHDRNIYMIHYATPNYYSHYINMQFFSLPGVPCLAKEVEAVPKIRFSFFVSLVATASPSLS